MAAHNPQDGMVSLAVESYLNMVEYTANSQDVVIPEHSPLTVLDWSMLHKIMLLNMLYRRG